MFRLDFTFQVDGADEGFRVIWRQVSTVTLTTPTNTSLSILTTLFAIKSLQPKLYSRRLTAYHLHSIGRLRIGNMFVMS
ncbi:hypothetical protein pdam_00018204 [Pocillopora damicornis]|uniref:Uncharacterized protein n=1 Tax=Pocillopora damicornis TaxID=46731 RepID=A0A3M6U9L3_POCDA|nr:hypothetical protein pdam_00018204 [Pocillopora damicornis]